jgi:hypothetical protein
LQLWVPAGLPLATGTHTSHPGRTKEFHRGGSKMNGPAGTVTGLARRADAGTVRPGLLDVAGLVLAGDMYEAPYDLPAAHLGVRRAGCGGASPTGGMPGTWPPGAWALARCGAG